MPSAAVQRIDGNFNSVATAFIGFDNEDDS
jgi:hypothetical protein